MSRFMRIWFFLSIFITLTIKSYASHLFGADLYYTWVSGNTYTVSFVVYGDCSGTAFPSLSSSSPHLQVYNANSTYSQTYSMSLQAPTSGVEVTPVCDADKGNTTCNGGTVPGIKKFVYTQTVNLPDTSSKWVFLFDGTMSSTTSAGRSNSITNITIGFTGSVMQLRDTLNNVYAPNSSPQYTTIPTPFFCNGKAANYNPGAVDPNGDSLVFQLVPGLEPGGTVTYVSGYSATSPLAVSSGSFSFSTSTGQLSFTPNSLQKSLVVQEVREFRGDTLVGTSMREMTFVVLSCSNAPPNGKITSASGGTIIDSTDFKICKSADSFSFHIDPTSLDSANITITAAGLPAGSSYTITNNGTKTPTGIFSWNIKNVKPGTYTFFLTYLDDACPLSSKQTQAYSVTILENPTTEYSLVSPATCTSKAVFTVTSAGAGSWITKIYSGTTLKDSINHTTASITDSLAPGTYTIRNYNSNGCYKDTSVTIVAPPKPTASYVITNPTCNYYTNGAIYITASNGTTPYLYALGSSVYGSSSSFLGLGAGTFTVHLKDSLGCTVDTTITLKDSLKVSATVALNNIACNGDSSGTIIVNATGGFGWPYLYALDAGSFVSSSTFLGLWAKTYTLHVKDTMQCYFDTTIALTQPTKLVPSHTVTNVDCYGNATGQVIEAATGGAPPYMYSDDGTSYSTSGNFSGLTAGTYVIRVKDTNDCVHYDTMAITQPPKLIISAISSTEPKCYDSSNGTYTLTVSGGVSPYQYQADGAAYGTARLLTGFKAGTHTLFIKDANNCITDTTVDLTQPDSIVIGAMVKQSTCKTLSDGEVILLASGGTPGYTYQQSSGGYVTSPAFKPLAAGSYVFYIKDNNDCVKDTTISIKDSLYITGTINIKNVTCFGDSNGAISVTPIGGATPYVIAFDNGTYDTVYNFKNYPAGSYTIQIKDSLGCINDTSVAITQPGKITIATTVTPNACEGLDNNGAVALNVSGGTQPFAYSWDTYPNANGSSINGMPNGIYTVVVTDSNGCSDSAIAHIAYDDCCKPFVPTAFTPNGDGINDLFRPLFKGDMTLLTFNVYNRFGQLVFTTTRLGEGWDGNLNDVPQEVGAYYWYLKIICGNKGDHVVQLKGDVTLIR